MIINGLSIDTVQYMQTFYSFFISCLVYNDTTHLYDVKLNDRVNIYIHNKSIKLEFGGINMTLEPNCYTSFICE